MLAFLNFLRGMETPIALPPDDELLAFLNFLRGMETTAVLPADRDDNSPLPKLP